MSFRKGFLDQIANNYNCGRDLEKSKTTNEKPEKHMKIQRFELKSKIFYSDTTSCILI